MKNNILIIIVIIGLLVLGFLYLEQKNKVIEPTYIPYAEEATSTTAQSQSNQVSQNNQSPAEVNPSVETSSSVSLENIETPLFIKSIYQKNGKWWADVDYVTIVSAREYAKFKIENGSCVIPNMTKQQMLNYLSTVKILYGDVGIVEYEDSVFGDPMSGAPGCFLDLYASDVGPGYVINQNPLIRSFPFASNFTVINTCNNYNSTILEIKQQVDIYRTYDSNGNFTNLNYSYGLTNTQGVFQRKAIIKNSEIEKFDYVNGCAG